MKTCKTCKWWKDEEDRLDRYTNAKKCTSPHVHFARINSYVADERLLTTDEDERDPLPPTDAGVLDGSGYWGALFPGPDFGCIHHEEKT